MMLQGTHGCSLLWSASLETPGCPLLVLWGTHGYSLLWLLPLETPVCSLLVLWGTHGCSPLSFVSPESSGRSLLVLRGAPKGAHPHSWALWGTPSVRRGGSLWPLPPSSPRLGAGGGEPRRSFPPPIPPADLWAPMGAVGPTQPAGRPGVPQVLHGPTARRDQPQGPQDPQHPIGHPAGAPPRGQRHREVRG